MDIKKSLKKLREANITVLPDFYLDILINPNMSYEKLMKEFDEVYKRGGGNLLGPKTQIVPGGNGGNVAMTLGGLGVNTAFISNSSEFGKILIEFFMHPYGVRTYISPTGETAISLIFEIPHGTTKYNVMLCSAGTVANFSSDVLIDEQWKVLKESNVVAITNAQNLEMEDLVEAILSEILPTTAVSIDFSDLTPHIQRIDGFRKRILEHPIKPPTFIFGNENEVRLLAKSEDKIPEVALRKLSLEYPEIVFGCHMTKKAEIWQGGDQMALEPCFNIEILKATGAGDFWHAGFLVGDQLDLSIPETVSFANAVAGYQISKGKIATLKEIIDFSTSTSRYDLTT